LTLRARPFYLNLIITGTVQERLTAVTYLEHDLTILCKEREPSLEVIELPIIDDTVRLQATFKNWAGVLIDPTDITLTIYDNTKTVLEVIELESIVKVSTGVYYYEYVVPSVSIVYYEFDGIAEDTHNVLRGSIKPVWIQSEE